MSVQEVLIPETNYKTYWEQPGSIDAGLNQYENISLKRKKLGGTPCDTAQCWDLTDQPIASTVVILDIGGSNLTLMPQ